MVRGSLNGISALFLFLVAQTGYIQAGIWTGVIVMSVTYWAIGGLEETFWKDLDYLEE